MSQWIDNRSAPLPDIPTRKPSKVRQPTASAWTAFPDGVQPTEIITDHEKAAIELADAQERAKLDVQLNIIMETQAARRDAAAWRSMQPVVASARSMAPPGAVRAYPFRGLDGKMHNAYFGC